MLVDNLVARARRCAELQHMLDEDPTHKDAPKWIAEIAQKALNRKEDRHVAVVRAVKRIRERIGAIEAHASDDKRAKEHLKALQKRVAEMGPDDKGRERFGKKIQDLKNRLENPPAALHEQKIPALKRRIEELCASDDLLTKEDVFDG